MQKKIIMFVDSGHKPAKTSDLIKIAAAPKSALLNKTCVLAFSSLFALCLCLLNFNKISTRKEHNLRCSF